MMKKLEILGMALDNYTVQEAMLQVEGFLGSDIMNTVETISMDTLVRAQEDGQLRECIEGLDLTVVSDKEILKAAEAASPPTDAGNSGQPVPAGVPKAGVPQ